MSKPFQVWCKGYRWRYLPKVLGLVGLLFGAAMQGGCAQQSTAPAENPNASQIIIRFAPEVKNPAEQQFLAKLAHDCGVALTYVRPMAGSAHVLKIAGDEEAGLQCLSRRVDIIYVERDRIMHPQGKESEHERK